MTRNLSRKVRPLHLLRLSISIPFLLILFLFSSCEKSENQVSITLKNFNEEILLKQNLVFTFNKNLVGSDQINKWTDEQFIEFNPPIPGSFKWTASNELTFSPFDIFTPSTKFTATPKQSILKHAENKSLTLKSEKFNFNTPFLELKNAFQQWKLSSINAGEAILQTQLVFNSDINPIDLKDKIKIEVNGKEAECDIISQYISSKVLLEIKDIDSFNSGDPIKISIDKDLKILTSNWRAPQNYVFNSNIPEKNGFVIKNISTDHNGLQGILYVVTDQEVKPNSMKPNISIIPKVEYTVEISDNGFLIKSDKFSFDKNYEIVIQKELEGILGGQLKENFTKAFAFGKVQPKINFTDSKAMYLGASGNRNLSLEIVGIQNLQLEITKVFENNLQEFLRRGKSDRYHWGEDYDISYEYYRTGNIGQKVYSEEINVTDLQSLGARKLLNISFEDKLPDFQGIYIISLRDNERNWLTDSKIVALSDIGLISKQEKDRIYVFANSIKTTASLPNVKVDFFSSNNQKLYTATTDENGVAVFPEILKVAPDFNVSMITAEKGKDFNFMDFNKSQVRTSRFELPGKSLNSSGYEAFIFSERDIYRPGETVNIAAIVRDHDWGTPSEMPLKVEFKLPNGKTFKTIRKVLNENGALQLELPTSNAMSTGRYRASLLTANDQELDSYSFALEEFMPDRIKVKVDIDREEIILKENNKFTVDIGAQNFFGPPAANRKFQANVNFRRAYFRSEQFPSYKFQSNKNNYISSLDDEGKTDSEGNAQIEFEVKEEYTDMGILNGTVFATVFDESGRPVYKSKKFKVVTQDLFYGIGDFDYYVGTSQALSIPMVVVDKDGKNGPSATANLNIVRFEYKTVLQKNNSGYYNYISQKQEVVEENRNIELSGSPSTFTYTPTKSGRYEVRISEPGAKQYVSKVFYAYGRGSTESTAFEVNNDGNIQIELDKEKYETGETVTALFKTPFSGKMLVTLEQEDVQEYFYINTDKKAAELTFNMSNQNVPSTYISATLIKPHENNNLPLMVAHGYKMIEVHNPSNSLDIEIEAIEKSRSKTKQTIKIKTQPNTEMTLAVVDEGILQLTNFQSPNPYDFFYQNRALEVESSDLYPLLYPELMQQSLMTGGGDGGSMSKRINPLASERVDLTRFWSGIIKSNANGLAEYEIDIPSFSGDLRIMAVAFKENSFGSATENIIVADPIVISTALPRFLSPNDQMKVPVSISNTTDETATGKVWIKAESPIKLTGDEYEMIEIPPHSEKMVEFAAFAEKQIEHGKVIVSVETLGEKFTQEIKVPVRPASSLQKKSGAGSVTGGTEETISLEADYAEETIDGKLIVSKSPLIGFADNLEYLVRYPYGCLEQTISSAFPQLYYQDLVTNLFGDDQTGQAMDPNYNVQQAIDKITTMQMSDGGLTYWPGRGYGNWWGSIYALHFLYEAQEKGFEVNQSCLDNLKFYLKTRLQKKETFVYYYNRSLSKEIASKEIFYSLYTLALVGDPQISTMNYYKANPELMSIDSKYMLATAYHLAGDRNKFAEILPGEFTGETSNKSFAGSFHSHIRDLGISLNCLLTAKSDHPQIPILARQLSKQMKGKRYMNTQERVFGFLALGKIAERSNQNSTTGKIIANGQEVALFNGQNLEIDYHDIGSKEFNIQAEGEGELYYFWDIEGLSMSNDYEEKDNYLSIRKTLYDKSGNKIDPDNIKQNDLIVVKLNLKSLSQKKVENVVVTDIIPAGFEIENPRLNNIASTVSWAKMGAMDHFDIRDDRVLFFTTARNTKKGQDYYYLARAVSKGDFIMGPASADAMYDGEFHSYNGGRMVSIRD